ncbi:Na/Pi cotransporter family protein [Pygmaiobacter massiliensis]|uniref:Na/Pi cotransporter family protein n=1 Tax=Pygmaiobacter massiliensis TaxID=1917873 RepID=UPI000C79A7C1|nr:Na/Pi cotransporter family protein [Pygmaiobacter massiliensis]
MNIFSAISLAGGIALFLYGMSIMGSGLEKLAGGQMEGILKKLTSTTLMAVISGAVLTGLIQSSAATTVIVIGLVNSGIMQLSQAIGVIMGANIGTTVTGQIIRMSDLSGDSLVMQLLKPTTIAPIVAFIGAILYVFFKAPKKRNIGQIMLGFGILFTGMFTMENAVAPLRESELFLSMFAKLQNPLLGILAGALVTIAIQSSSASVGILQALSTTGVVTWGSAIPIILGQNIGTCSTPLMAAIGASKGAKRAAMVHLYFNVIGTIAFMGILYGVKMTIGIPFWNEVMNRGDIANFHTLFNVVTTLLFLPFTKVLAKLAMLTIPDSETEQQDSEMPILDERLFNSPAVAIQQAHSAVEKMASHARANYAVAVPLLFSHDLEIITQVNAREEIIDKLEYYIANYLVKVSDHDPSEDNSHVVSELFAMITEFERIGDYSINVVERSGEIFDKEIVFSASAKEELMVLDAAIKEILELASDSFRRGDIRLAERIEPLEETIDTMCEILHHRHIERLKSGKCAIESGVVFLEIITNLERIADHCSNIAARLIGSESEDEEFDAHELRRRLHDGHVEGYNDLLASYELKYISPIREEIVI